jgi:hypothetical protein
MCLSLEAIATKDVAPVGRVSKSRRSITMDDLYRSSAMLSGNRPTRSVAKRQILGQLPRKREGRAPASGQGAERPRLERRVAMG